MSDRKSASAAACEVSRCRPGLLHKLVAAVRPEFRADALVADTTNPMFGPGPCAVGREGSRIMIESMNSRIRQATRRRGHFPNEQAALKVHDDHGAEYPYRPVLAAPHDLLQLATLLIGQPPRPYPLCHRHPSRIW